MKEDTEKWVHSVQDSEWGLESARATVEIDWEPNDSVLACFDWSGVVSGCEASCHVCIGSIVSVGVYTKKDICEQCRSGTQEWQHKWLTTRIQLIPPLNRWWRRSLRRSTVTTHCLSDSDNEKSSPTTFKAKVYRIFGREKPIHKVLNGGKPIDVVLWEKKNFDRSAWWWNCSMDSIRVAWIPPANSSMPLLDTRTGNIILVVQCNHLHQQGTTTHSRSPHSKWSSSTVCIGFENWNQPGFCYLVQYCIWQRSKEVSLSDCWLISGGAGKVAGGYQGYGVSRSNLTTYDGRMDSNKYVQP